MVSFAAVVEQSNRSKSIPSAKHAARPRKINPSAGHALEILGHAIEYLLDECASQESPAASTRGQLEAIHILKSINREIYLDCPEKPTLWDRLQRLFASRIPKHRITPGVYTFPRRPRA